MLKQVVSGGQTGVDRAALDAALRVGLSIGGWCPRGRKAEDGPIGPPYPLNETGHDDDRTRTDWNIRDSNGTLVLNQGPIGGGTQTTIKLAQSRYRAPLVVDLDQGVDPEFVSRWIADHKVATLNVAGPRESKRPASTRRRGPTDFEGPCVTASCASNQGADFGAPLRLPR